MRTEAMEFSFSLQRIGLQQSDAMEARNCLISASKLYFIYRRVWSYAANL
jgi:hypothetical protein